MLVLFALLCLAIVMLIKVGFGESIRNVRLKSVGILLALEILGMSC